METNGNQNPNGIGQWKPKPQWNLHGKWKQKPQFNHKNQIILMMYQNSYPKFRCPMETKTLINS